MCIQTLKVWFFLLNGWDCFLNSQPIAWQLCFDTVCCFSHSSSLGLLSPAGLTLSRGCQWEGEREADGGSKGYPTGHFTILQPQTLPVGCFYVLQKRQMIKLELGNIWSGSQPQQQQQQQDEEASRRCRSFGLTKYRDRQRDRGRENEK